MMPSRFRVLVVTLLPVVSGCFAAIVREAPPRDEWDEANLSCDTSSPLPGVALGLAAVSGFSALYLASDDGEPAGLTQRDLGVVVLVPLAGLYTIDAVIGYSHVATCREYRRTWTSDDDES